MGAMFRSETMSLCQLFIQPEAAYQSVAELGEIGIAQFRDLNPELSMFQRKFTAEVRRCDEMERKVNYIKRELIKDGNDVPDLWTNLPSVPNPREFIDLEARFEKTENEILELSENFAQLLQNFQELTELRYVLERTQSFFSDQNASANYEATKGDEINLDNQQQQLAFVAGVIDRERVLGFERMLWRISRGNVFLRQADIEKPFTDPKTDKEIYKNVFVAFFQGEQLKSRVKKVCAGYRASLYPCPDNYEEREDMLKGVQVRLQDLNMVINQTQDQRQRVLNSVIKDLPQWVVMVKKIKAIYHTMNMFNMDVSQKCLIGECWIPTDDMYLVQKALLEGSTAVGSTVPSFMNVISTNENPPTFNRTNKFTAGFQALIDAFGIATYREANPSLYTIITFPFLFAIMFGDLGHGAILFLFGLWMVTSEEKLLAQRSKNEIWNIFFGGRYIIFLMGIFSCYTGFIYNDVFSKSMNIFGSSWEIQYNTSTVMENPMLQLNPASADLKDDSVYLMGLDPVWQLGTNKIIFLNSYKMKLSIIFGVVHMIFGVIMSTVNFTYRRNYSSLFLEFLPQLLFLVLLFAYMCFMMFFKWIVFSPKSEQPWSPGCAPSVLIYFINMMLFGSNKVLDGCQEYMYPGQGDVQLYAVLIALLCIPWMLLGKPLYLTFFGRKGGHGHGGHEEEPMSEVWIHQAIHTIEYVLSTISHTASYLRLWALSLAHAQLSEVLWNMLMTIGTHQTSYFGAVVVFLIFGAWAVLTLAILVMMEGLSAFLHTLRLHWVEFMSKFYEGAGYIFQPFSFKTVLEEVEE